MSAIFSKKGPGLPSCAVFLSGAGTNAMRLAEHAKSPDCPWRISVLVTDRPRTSAAKAISEKFSIPLVSLDIAEFYRARGMEKVSIATSDGMAIREEWTLELKKLLSPYGIDFGLLAGFIPLSNIVNEFPCLNVHPGDLTIEENGRRVYAGLHRIPMERAILNGLDGVRSSVILVQPVSAGGKEMDLGPVLGVSEKMPLDLAGRSVEELASVLSARKTPAGGAGDELARIADGNIERLKECGDWVVFPGVADDFARGYFSLSSGGRLLYRGLEVKTVEYSKTHPPVPVR